MKFGMRGVKCALVTAALVAGSASALLFAPSAQAAQPSIPGQTRMMPSAVPSAITPSIDNGQVSAIAQVGNTMVLGGTFTSVGGVSHSYVLAFDATSGAIVSGFNPNVNGAVNAVIPGPTAGTVYLGGEFTQVNGVAAQFLTLLNVSTGQIVSTFQGPAFNYGYVMDLVLRSGRLYVAGVFTKANGVEHDGLVTVNPNTGRLDPFMGVQLTGHHNDSGSGAQGWVGATDFDVTPNGSTMVVVGNFKYANGLLRNQVALIDLTGTSAALAPWATTGYAPYCFNWAFDQYVRGVAMSPDGSYFVVNATGGGNPGTLCDSATRFNTNISDTNAQPAWIDQTGGDTVWGVTITNTAVFVGGHNRWMNNPYGADHPLAGAVPRAGLQALDPISGRVLAWNPGRVPLGVSAFAFLATSQGLWMGSDTDYVGNYAYKRPKIALFPWAGGSPVASTTTASLPGNVFLASGGAGQSNVVYRVNAAGPTIRALDNGPNWLADNTDPSPYRNNGSNVANWGGSVPVTSNVPATTPNAIFATERWSPSDNPPMNWSFPMTTGTTAEVRLYFVNQYSGTSQVGQRVFNVSINGNQVLTNYDIVAAAGGNQIGTMQSFNTTAQNGTITINFSHVRENPLINGIEIVRTGVPAPPAGTSSLTKVAFDGTTATSAAVDPQGIDFANWRGAFLVGSKVFYGYTDGYLYSRTFDGTTFGAAVQINPYHDPKWANVSTGDGDTFDGALPDFYSQIPNLTGMVYSQGRVYFTLFGDPHLYSAWFSPDSGVIDETIATQPSGVDLSSADGLFLNGSTLYYGSSNDGDLRSVAFSGGAITGSPTIVSGPAQDGVNWINAAMFLAASSGVPNNPPMASFTSSCQNLICGFDGTSSLDTDGSVVSYAWNFGDGATGTGPTPAHGYGGPGTYHVTLTATDDGGATGTVTQDVTVTQAATGIQFIGAGNAGGGSTNTRTVTVPSAAAVGDAALLFLTAPANAGWSAPGGVTGWSQVDTFTKGSLVTTVWVKTLAAGDPGATVRLTNAAFVHSAFSIAVYRGVSTTSPIDTFAHQGEINATSHVTPAATATSGDWALSYWGDRSTAARTYTAPSTVTVRDASPDAGGLTTQTLVADSNGPLASGGYGGLTATTDAATAVTSEWTILLRSASPNPPPAQIAFKGAADAGGGSVNTRTVVVPVAASVGDTALLFLTAPSNAAWSAPSGVTGWAQVDAFTVSTLTTTVWVKALVAGDPGATVRLTNSGYTHTGLSIAVYSGVSASAPIDGFAHQGDTSSASHVTPSVTASIGDWGVSYWGDRSSATRTYTAPASVTARDASTDSGGLTTQALIADSNGPLAAGAYGGLTATTDAAAAATASWTILLQPAS